MVTFKRENICTVDDEIRNYLKIKYVLALEFDSCEINYV